MNPFPFVIETRNVDDGIDLVYFDIVDMDAAISYLDDHVVSIFCGQNSALSLDYAKECFRRLFVTKLSNEALLCGSIAEFFAHLLLNHYGYKQDCLYQNLEERSVKKGFDGVYSIDDELWLMESKSGIFNGALQHYDKVTEATSDLKNKVSGRGGKNDPWSNAYHHANLIDVGAKETIRSQIRALMESYAKGEFRDVSEFNIIPCATLFYEERIDRETLDTLAHRIKSYFSGKLHRGIFVVCISNVALDGFLAYLDLRRGGNE